MKYLMEPIWLVSFFENDNVARTSRETRCRNVADAIARHAGKPGNRYVCYDGTELPW